MSRLPIKRLLACAIVAAFAAQVGTASAIGMLDAYEAALKYDPTYQAAIHENNAGQENRNLGRAGLLPNVAFSYNTSRNKADVTTSADGRENTVHPDYISRAANLQLRQTLFNLDAVARYRQGVAQSQYAGAVFSTRKQDLVVRLVGAYADAQFTEEQLALSIAQRDAYLEQQRVNERMFEKGESTKTDVLETQSKYDTAQAQVIEAQDNVTTARNNLAAIIGSDVTVLDPLVGDFKTRPLLPSTFEEWRTIAMNNNPEIEALRYGVDAAYHEISKARAGHAPRVDFTATYSRTDSDTLNTLNQEQTNRAVGLQVNVPLYSGGYVNAASRQAVANHERAKSELETKTKQILVELRKQYALNLSSVTRIDALVKAEKSAALVVDATRQSIKGGVRINLDLLNAQQQLFAARRDLAQGRYNYVMSYLRLRGAAGTLGGDDLQEVAGYFKTAAR